MIYPQNGDRIVTIDSVTSLHPLYTDSTRHWQYHGVIITLNITQWVVSTWDPCYCKCSQISSSYARRRHSVRLCRLVVNTGIKLSTVGVVRCLRLRSLNSAAGEKSRRTRSQQASNSRGTARRPMSVELLLEKNRI